MKANHASSSGKAFLGTRRVARFGLLALLALYVVAQPRLNERFGWNLPGLNSGEVSAPDSPESESGADSLAADGPSSDELGRVAPFEVDRSGERPVARPDVAIRQNEFIEGPGASESVPVQVPGENLKYGLLKKIGGDRYASPAGLTYGPGSAEGHRLEHLKRHTRDQPSRPGKHGVFDGGMEGALSSVDLAYQFAKQRRNSRREDDRNRTIYTVDVERRVGYVGGRDGKSRGNPPASRVKLVLEGTNVITAYPL